MSTPLLSRIIATIDDITAGGINRWTTRAGIKERFPDVPNEDLDFALFNGVNCKRLNRSPGRSKAEDYFKVDPEAIALYIVRGFTPHFIFSDPESTPHRMKKLVDNERDANIAYNAAESEITIENERHERRMVRLRTARNKRQRISAVATMTVEHARMTAPEYGPRLDQLPMELVVLIMQYVGFSAAYIKNPVYLLCKRWWHFFRSTAQVAHRRAYAFTMYAKRTLEPFTNCPTHHSEFKQKHSVLPGCVGCNAPHTGITTPITPDGHRIIAIDNTISPTAKCGQFPGEPTWKINATSYDPISGYYVAVTHFRNSDRTMPVTKVMRWHPVLSKRTGAQRWLLRYNVPHPINIDSIAVWHVPTTNNGHTYLAIRLSASLPIPRTITWWY